MRSLSSTLLAAQRSASAAPYVRVEFSDYFGDVARLRWTRFYAGGEGDYHSAVAVAPDGSLVRARIDFGSPNVLYSQRVASPGPTSDYSQWTSHGAVSSQAAVALAVSAHEIRLFYVADDNLTLTCKTSDDDGASWSTAMALTTRSVAPTYLAAAYDGSGGDWALFWNEGATVYRWRDSLGSAAAWTNSLTSVIGLACTYQGDWDLVVTGVLASGESKAMALIYGDDLSQAANTWSTLREIAVAAAGSDVSYLRPSLTYIGGAWRAFFIERYLGVGAYDRLFWTSLEGTSEFNEELWREPVPFDYTGTYSVGAAVGGPVVNAWLASPAGVWFAPGPGDRLDVSDDLLEAEASADGDSGSLRLVLRNEDGRYNSPGSGPYALVRRGARVALSPGYRTTDGVEVSAGLEYWVDALEYVSGERSVAVVHARDGWSLLDRWRSRRQFQFAAGTKNVFNLLDLVFHRAGLDYSTVSASGPLTNFYPAFTIHPGESGRTAVRRLLALVPDRVRMRGALALGVNPLVTNASTYAYASAAAAQGGADHVILRGRYRRGGPSLNRVQAFGPGVLGERFDFAEIETTGDLLEQVQDLNLTSTATAGDRADALLRVAAIESGADEIVVRLNAGQEVWDIVSVSDPQAGLDAAKRRVLAWRLRYATGGRPAYEQTLTLGEP